MIISRQAIVAISICVGLFAARPSSASAAEINRPNLLWITAEDMSANLGCYGDEVADTPNLDLFATEGVRYSHAFASAPVCSPARSCLITGVYATSLGTQRLRSEFPIPAAIKGFPSYLRSAGYFTSNNVKTDYNVQDEQALIRDAWDRNGATAHWRQRKPGQPFFSVFNLMTTHQSRSNVWPDDQFEKEVGSQLRSSERTRAADVVVPPYYPDTPLVRRTLARYYDCVAVMDRQVGRILAELKEDKLVDDTIVFFYSDHGMGLPRGKRLLHDSGMHVPLIIRCPEKYRHLAPGEPGSISGQLVSFVDLPPTVLKLAGQEVPDYMQGRPFLGHNETPPRKYVYGARDRVDEACDVSRSIRDQRYLYIRNYMPHQSWMQPEWYSDQSLMRQQLTEHARTGKLTAGQLSYAANRKPIEELYDTQTDPHQIRNLADSAEYDSIKSQLRGKLREWLLKTRDLGFLSESDAWHRLRKDTPWHVAQDPQRYALKEVISTAEMVGDDSHLAEQVELLSDQDSAIRYWAAVGLHAAGVAGSAEPLRAALNDRSVSVKIEAAAALVALGDTEAMDVLKQTLASEQVEDVLHATRSLELLGDRARPALAELKQLFQRAEEQFASKSHPCWLFVMFSADAAIWKLEPDSTRPRMRF